MAAIIEIEDGSPWWVSQDIWVVPGDDPDGKRGLPLAGTNNYLWARVHNRSSSGAALGIRINFYWANPSAGVLRSTSHLIGSSNVDLDPQETKEVLCVVPWQPIIVNNGHECLVAEAVTALDPLPTPLPDAFDPPTYHQIAQTNLQVVRFTKVTRLLSLPLQVAAARRQPKQVALRIENAPQGSELAARLLQQLHEPALPYNDHLTRYALTTQGGCLEPPLRAPQQLEVAVPAGQAQAIYVQVMLADDARPGVQLLHIEETVQEKVVGGNTILLIYNI